MLSKIVRNDKAEELELKPFVSPTRKEIGLIIAKKKREARRKKIIDAHKDDTVNAAGKEADAEASLLIKQKEQEMRRQLEKEYQAKLEQRVKQVQQNYYNSLEELAKLKQILYNKSENQLVDLVFSIVRKVIASEIKTTPEVVLGMLKRGFDKIRDAKEYEIKVNPIDYEIILKKKDEVKKMLKTTGTVKFTKDEHIERGGCQIVSEQGEISSEPGKHLDIIMRELANKA
ncbi:MAG: hypothetical protein GTO45_37600 [Candidatus Aminicenantes bacterium]|nr:hypothetical protein [Candidatus Aminicenantes bacterium]NIM84381.1 hypothetical protein [Candidatus Aminicenantes bacterium]NIN23868.1 hypothetical protein [Candidatus Aminicenantes bacterium]NIN47584.1 hypothetical protein [Candidatus Aminicenantes bacterium]NIN90504.1 hypothetical protein [Candidatus Aminicenantes bacterium]